MSKKRIKRKDPEENVEYPKKVPGQAAPDRGFAVEVARRLLAPLLLFACINLTTHFSFVHLATMVAGEAGAFFTPPTSKRRTVTGMSALAPRCP
jgi:hypothetical protein